MNKKTNHKCIAVTGGGTGGHIMPILAVLEELRKDLNGKIVWISSRSKIDDMLIKGVNIKRYVIETGKLRRYFSLYNIIDMLKIIIGIFQSYLILKREKPGVLFSKGGYVSVPPVIAAYFLHIPVFTHESDINPGLATKINSFFSKKILISVPETSKYFKKKYLKKIVLTGNPVRKAMMNGNAKIGRKSWNCSNNGNNRKLILILGGSQGAASINKMIWEISGKLSEKYCVLHQTGVNNYTENTVTNKNYRMVPFIKNDLPHILKAADIIISRAGANAIWEYAVSEKAVILIPLPGSGSRGDQLLNAEYLEKAGAAVVLEQEKTSSAKLLETIEELLDNEKKRKTLGKNLNLLLSINGSERIARLMLHEIGEI